MCEGQDLTIKFSVYQDAAQQIADYFGTPKKQQQKIAPRTVEHAAALTILSDFESGHISHVKNNEQGTVTYEIDVQNFSGDITDIAFAIGSKTGEQDKQPYHSLQFNDLYSGQPLLSVIKGQLHQYGQPVSGFPNIALLAEEKEKFYKKFML